MSSQKTHSSQRVGVGRIYYLWQGRNTWNLSQSSLSEQQNFKPIHAYSWRGLGNKQSPSFSWMKSQGLEKVNIIIPQVPVCLVVEHFRLIFTANQNWESLTNDQILGFSPWVEKILWRREWQPTPVFLPGEFHGLLLVGYKPRGITESDTTEQLTGSKRLFLLLQILLPDSSCLFP